MKVKVKKLHKDAVIPKLAKEGDAGMDLTAVRVQELNDNYLKYYFGLAFEIPKGFVGLLIQLDEAYRKEQILSNCVGIITNSKEATVVMIGNTDNSYNVGDVVCKLIIIKTEEIEISEI